MTIWGRPRATTDKLVGTIQERYGYARDRAKAEVDAWMNGLADVR